MFSVSGNPPFGGRQHESQETHGGHGRDRDQKSNDGRSPFGTNRDQGSNDVETVGRLSATRTLPLPGLSLVVVVVASKTRTTLATRALVTVVNGAMVDPVRDLVVVPLRTQPVDQTKTLVECALMKSNLDKLRVGVILISVAAMLLTVATLSEEVSRGTAETQETTHVRSASEAAISIKLLVNP